MSNLTVRTLQTLIILSLIGSIPIQALIIPVYVQEICARFPELSASAPVYISLGIFAVLCVQGVLVGTLVLLNKIRNNGIFTQAATPWVNLITVLCGLGPIAIMAAITHLGIMHNIGNPTTVMAFLASLFGGAMLVLLLIVLRGLLQNATRFADDLAEVI